jgi:hypothetical protein
MSDIQNLKALYNDKTVNLTHEQKQLIKSSIIFRLQKPFKKGDIVVLKEYMNFLEPGEIHGKGNAVDWYGKNIKFEVEYCVEGMVFGRKILNGSGKKQTKISLINQYRLVDVDPTYVEQLILGEDFSPQQEVKDFVKAKKELAKQNRKLVKKYHKKPESERISDFKNLKVGDTFYYGYTYAIFIECEVTVAPTTVHYNDGTIDHKIRYCEKGSLLKMSSTLHLDTWLKDYMILERPKFLDK